MSVETSLQTPALDGVAAPQRDSNAAPVRDPSRPLLWTSVLLLASLCHSGVALLARQCMRTLPAAEVTCWRMGVGVAVCLIAFWSGAARFQVKRPRLVALRGILGGGAVLAYFLTIGRL